MSNPPTANVPETDESAANSTTVTRSKRRFAQMSAEEQRRAVEDGRKRVRNSTIRVSGCRNLKADNSTIHGDNNHVIGNFNVLIGVNNTAEGHRNTFSIPVEPPVPVPAAVATPPAELYRAQDDGEFVTQRPSTREMLGALLRGFMVNTIVLRANQAQAPPREQRPVTEGCVASALDLPGEAVAAADDEPRCDVCLENQKDTLFKPCRHICCCRECARTLAKQHLDRENSTSFKCPKCREQVVELAIVFI